MPPFVSLLFYNCNLRLHYIPTSNPFNYFANVTGFVRRGVMRAPLQHTGFTTILWIHHKTSMCACFLANISPVCFPEAAF